MAKEKAEAEARQATKKEKKSVEIEVLDDDAEEGEGDGDGAGKAAAAAAAAGDDDGDEDSDDDDGSPKPEGNGGKTDRYVWTQTLQDVTVTFPVRAGLKSKHLSVAMKADRLKLEIKGEDMLCDGELCQRIKTADSTWTIENSDEGRRVVFYLAKHNGMEWWDCVCKGDATINTRKIVPENSKLGDLDGDTRGVVEKMMFDQRQKAMGKPTSDEQKKQDMIANFMKQHPEMDFSNAKVC